MFRFESLPIMLVAANVSTDSSSEVDEPPAALPMGVDVDTQMTTDGSSSVNS